MRLSSLTLPASMKRSSQQQHDVICSTSSSSEDDYCSTATPTDSCITISTPSGSPMAKSSSKPIAISRTASFTNMLSSAGGVSSSSFGLRKNTSSTALRSMLFSSTAPSSTTAAVAAHVHFLSTREEESTTLAASSCCTYEGDNDDASDWTSAATAAAHKQEEEHYCGSPSPSSSSSNNPLRRLSRSLGKSWSFEELPKPTPPAPLRESLVVEARIVDLLAHTTKVRDLINVLITMQDGEGSKQLRFLFYVNEYEHELNLGKQKQMGVGILENFLSASSTFQLENIPREYRKRTVDNLFHLKRHFLTVLAENATVVDFFRDMDEEAREEALYAQQRLAGDGEDDDYGVDDFM